MAVIWRRWRPIISMKLTVKKMGCDPVDKACCRDVAVEVKWKEPKPLNFSTLPFFIPKPPAQNHLQNHLIIWNPKNLGNSLNSFFCSSSEPSFSRCWNCKRGKAFLICESCGSIQPVDHSVDYFNIFGLERKFDIDDGSLEGTYKNWQKKLHPDLVHTKSKEDREYAAEQSARVIEAYTTLRKPLLRAIYIMKLEGIEVDEEQTVSEPELLGEIMEIREAVEEAPDSRALNQIQSQGPTSGTKNKASVIGTASLNLALIMLLWLEIRSLILIIFFPSLVKRLSLALCFSLHSG